MPNSNSEILSTFRDRRRLDYEKAIENLDNEITVLKRQKTAEKQLYSGATLKCVRDLCKSTISGLADSYRSEIRNAVDKQILMSAPDLPDILHRIFTDSLPDQLTFANERLSDAVAMVGVERVLNGLLADVSNHYESVSEKLLTDIKLSVSSLRVEEKKTARAVKRDARQKLKIIIAVAALIIAAAALIAQLYFQS